MQEKKETPTNHPHHVEGAVEDVLLSGGKFVSINLHGYGLSK